MMLTVNVDGAAPLTPWSSTLVDDVDDVDDLYMARRNRENKEGVEEGDSRGI